MRNKVIGFIILLIGLSLLTIGIIYNQQNLINLYYDQMVSYP